MKFGLFLRSTNPDPNNERIVNNVLTFQLGLGLKNTERNITAETENHEKAVDAETMRNLLVRVPPSSQVHIVFAAKLQEKYFTLDETWEKFKSNAQHLQNTTYVKVKATRGEERNSVSVELSLQLMFIEETSRPNQNNRLVMFYPIEDMQH